MTRLVSALAVVTAACSAPQSSQPPAAGELAFPRIATYYIETFVDDRARQVMAQSDVVIVDAEAAALDRGPLDALRRARPELLDEPVYLLVDGEHVKLVAITGDTLTVERGVRSRAVPHAAGVRIARVPRVRRRRGPLRALDHARQAADDREYDEYDGAGRGRHWLGRARGPSRREGTLAIREFEHGLAVAPSPHRS
ncbi:MAG TPA: hypothetical protein VFQ53_11520 [Kofleriaceae bacterium]|nr:hypothetical protein [Kofleriaceae bacterium]